MHHEQDDSQGSQEYEGKLSNKITRRSFLRGVGRAIAGTSVLALAPAIAKSDSGGDTGLSRELESIPDLLSENELSQHNITVNNSDETQLFLREGIFDFDLFKDAKEGKIGGVEITLIDNDSLSWNSFSKLDDEFLRTLGLAIAIDPEHYVNLKYDETRSAHEAELKSSESSYRRNLEDLRLLNNGELVPKIEESIMAHQEILSRLPESVLVRKPYIDQIKEMRERIERVEDGTERDILVEAIEMDRVIVEDARELLSHTQDRESAVDYFADNSPAMGVIVKAPNGLTLKDEERSSDRQREMATRLDELDPNWRNKVYIFTSVGGKATPKPEDSYPDKEWFKKYETNNFFTAFNPDAYLVDIRQPKALASFVLRHEVSHYKQGKLLPEKFTDIAALESIAGASQTYQETGETTKYPFVFKNRHGITYAKNKRDSTRSSI